MSHARAGGTRRRPSNVAATVLALLALALLAALLHAAWAQGPSERRMLRTQSLVRALDLTDAAWFTEARYTRHLTQADLHAPFQDGPGALEHFPAGSFVPPPHPFPGTTAHAIGGDAAAEATK